jgi:hypothetical protein
VIHGHIDGVIEAKDQVVKGFANAPYQGGDHAVWICGNRGAFDRCDRAPMGMLPPDSTNCSMCGHIEDGVKSPLRR